MRKSLLFKKGKEAVVGQSRAGAFLIDITQPEGSRWRPRATHTPRERAREKIRFPTLAPAIKSFGGAGSV